MEARDFVMLLDSLSASGGLVITAVTDSLSAYTGSAVIAIDNNVFAVLDSWPPEWRAPDLAESDKTTIQRQKDVAKLLAQQK